MGNLLGLDKTKREALGQSDALTLLVLLCLLGGCPFLPPNRIKTSFIWKYYS
ncbi:hypothetical protein DSOL_3418 [Desulfosporosinus metallidurans]|uniref:Uncharacterized protein n=1 Tax=Desulfosporosinus metallidurans TaxID=1888891 RepID=A0A1Q8QQY2_9FIRM|nr:hypothetical protein DSOL_3418 [Desulfosporosinus metallidurans]